MKLAIAAAVVLLGANAAVFAQEWTPVSAAQLEAGAVACAAAVGSQGVDLAALATAGFEAAEITGTDGSPSDAALDLFSTQASPVLLMVPRENASNFCMVAGRLIDSESVNSVVSSLTALFNVQPVQPEGDPAAYWFPENQIVQLSARSDQGSVSIRISVGTQ